MVDRNAPADDDHERSVASASRKPGKMVGRRTFVAGVLTLAATSACGAAGGARDKSVAAGRRPRPDLYDCEGCEGAGERNPQDMRAHARMAPDGEPGQPLTIEGMVYRTDGRSPAADVIIYAYQTDASGLYSRGRPGTDASLRHGLLRGWVRTGPDGRYRFDTIKPAPYPDHSAPAHIHFTVLEPGRRPYWIDDIVFAGEFGVTPAYLAARENRGGDGVVRLVRDGGRLVARRDIVLEPHPD